MPLFGQSGGIYDRYSNTFLNAVDLLRSLLQAVLMALSILLINAYLDYFATGGPSGVGVAVDRQRSPHVADPRGVGDANGVARGLRFERNFILSGCRIGEGPASSRLTTRELAQTSPARAQSWY